MKRVNSNLLVCVVGMMTLVGCVQRQKTAVSDVVPVKTTIVGTTADVAIRTYVGTIEESYGSQLSFATMGTVNQVLADEGKAVRKGEVLAVLDKSTLMNTYLIAKSTLNQAHDAFRRMEALYKKGSLPEIKFIEIQTQVSQAEASERIARKNLSDCVLCAPFSGYISKRMVDAGNNVAPGIGCFKLVKIDEVKVKISVPEKEVSSIRMGQSIGFTVDALGGRRFIGRVVDRGVQANALSHTYDIKLQLSNKGHQLLPGMVCSAEMNARGEGSGIVVPQESVLISGSDTYVWIAVGGRAQKRMVKTGGTNDRGVIVAEGLSNGDAVIVSGQNKVSEGSKIRTL
jgi:membrane fusion protein (multidrug efflux system)